MTLTTRLAGALVASTLALSTTALVDPAPALAADGQVCTTAPAPTPSTAPWSTFAQAGDGSAMTAKNRFDAFVADLAPLLAPLGPSSTQDQVNAVKDVVEARLDTVTNNLEYTVGYAFGANVEQLLASLQLVAPDSVAAAESEVDAAYDAILTPGLAPFQNDGAFSVFVDTLMNNLGGTFPLTGPVPIPPSAAASAGFVTLSQALERFYALGLPHVVFSGTATTCTPTATLSVPAATTGFGRGTTVTIGATKDGMPVRGDLVVLLDGQEIGTGRQQSSYVATVPATLAPGTHTLTVAFAPIDGSPIATRSSTITVTRATTATKLTVKKGKAAVTVTAPGVAAPVDGTATIKVGKQKLTTKIKNGRGTIKLRKLDAGSYRLKAAYAGSDSFAPSTSKAVKVKVGT